MAEQLFDQVWFGSQAGFVASGSFTVPCPGATPDTLLFALVGYNSGAPFDDSAIETPTGWLAASPPVAPDSDGAALFYRIATGDAGDTITPTWTGGNTARLGVYVGEITNVDSANPFVDINGDNNYGQLNVPSLSTGNVTPEDSIGTVLTAFVTSAGQNWTALTDTSDMVIVPAIDRFTPAGEWAGSNGRPAVSMGLYAHTTTDPVSFEWFSATSQGQCLVAAFALRNAGGGPGPTPEEVSFTKINAALTTSGQVNLDRADVRALAEVPTGEIAFSDFFGKLTP